MLSKLIAQPLVQFFAIGAGLFLAFGLTNDIPQGPERPEIVVSLQDAQWLRTQFKATWRRDPTVDELSALMDEFVREEVYVRQALLLGLDQGDQIVRRRLRQKMEFLTESGAEAVALEDETLLAFYEANADTYRTQPRAAFSQILLPDVEGQTQDQLMDQLASGAEFDTLGVRTMLPARVPASPAVAVDNVFGAGVFEQVADLQQGVWSGPVQSGFGVHLVRLDDLQPGVLPPFDTVRERVELDWRAQRAQELRKDRFEQMEAQYLITRPDPAEVLAQ